MRSGDNQHNRPSANAGGLFSQRHRGAPGGDHRGPRGGDGRTPIHTPIILTSSGGTEVLFLEKVQLGRPKTESGGVENIHDR